MAEFDVSVVVCTFNRSGLLRDALRTLTTLHTDGFRYEVVVVDNSSTDDTPEVIRQAVLKSSVTLRGVREDKPGVSCARNRGVREAKGDWIAFFDDDQVADPDWLINLLALAKERKAQVVGGVIRLRLPEGSPTPAPECRALLGESVGMDAVRQYDRRSCPGAGNLMLHRSVFERVGVFDESLRAGGEDTDLFRRIYAMGIESWYTPFAIGYHVIPEYRLGPEYLRWKCLRDGGHLARRNQHERSQVMFLAILLARAVQGLFIHLPRWAVTRLLGARTLALGVSCLLWRCQGYVRTSLSLLSPRWFAQTGFFAQLDFRSERELFAGK